jgi:hypothetical protein
LVLVEIATPPLLPLPCVDPARHDYCITLQLEALMSTPSGPGDARLPSLAAGQRIGDAERERAATALSEHFAAGRLDRSEFDVRLDAAYAALTSADLQPLFADLPGPTPLPASVTPRDSRGRRPRAVFFVPPILPILLLIGIVTIATDGRFPFFIFPLLWLTGAFRRRRSW